MAAGRGGVTGSRPAARTAPGAAGGRGRLGRWREGRDRGVASVWAVGLVALLLAGFGVVLLLGQLAGLRQRVATGADLAALAAADRALRGADAACAAAGRVAAAHRVRVVRCDMAGEIADLSVAGEMGPYAVTVRARAGPAAAAVP